MCRSSLNFVGCPSDLVFHDWSPLKIHANTTIPIITLAVRIALGVPSIIKSLPPWVLIPVEINRRPSKLFPTLHRTFTVALFKCAVSSPCNVFIKAKVKEAFSRLCQGTESGAGEQVANDKLTTAFAF